MEMVIVRLPAFASGAGRAKRAASPKPKSSPRCFFMVGSPFFPMEIGRTRSPVTDCDRSVTAEAAQKKE
jgi:hypothetical protein